MKNNTIRKLLDKPLKDLTARPAHVKILIVFTMSFLCVVIYSNTFNSTFHYDDYGAIVGNINIRNLARLDAVWDFSSTRFIPHFTFAINYHLHKLNVFGYHVFNIVIHIGASVLVWWLTSLTFSTPLMRDRDIAGSSGLIAFFSALIFLVHPIQVEGVTYIVQRATSLASLFYLLSLCLFMRFRLSMVDKKPRSMRILCLFGTFTAGVFGVFTKEIIVTLPLAMIACEVYFFRPKNVFNRKYFILTPVLVTVALIMIHFKTVNVYWICKEGIENVLIRSRESNLLIYYILTQFRILVTYVRLLFFPVNQNIYYEYSLVKSIISAPFIASVFFLGVICVYAVKSFSKYKILSFGISFFFIAMLPEFTIFPLHFFMVGTPRHIIFEHRLYLSTAGYAIFLVSQIYYIFQNKSRKVMIMILLLVVGVYSCMTYLRNFAWRDEFTLWNDSLLKSPEKSEAYNGRGVGYINMGEYDKAITDFSRAIEIRAGFSGAYNNRGNAYQLKGEFQKAISDYSSVIKLDDFQYRNVAYYNRGAVYQKLGALEPAISDYNRVIESVPEHAEAYVNRGLVYAEKGDTDEALLDFNSALEINSNYALAYYNRGNIYLRKMDLGRAIRDYDKAIDIWHGFSLAHNNRAQAYASKGDLDAAISGFTEAIAFGANFIFYNNRGLAYARKGEADLAIFDFSESIRINPTYAPAYNNRAVIHFEKQRYSKSKEDIEKAKNLGYPVKKDFLRDLERALEGDS